MRKFLNKITRTRNSDPKLRAELPSHPHFDHFRANTKEVFHVVALHVAALLVIQHGNTLVALLVPGVGLAAAH